ncbi:MAG TPA: hypothetical protein PKC43_04955 [Phycisphaerales bacterium]|nr:hypothetical protein [Phycisphaerales bacterium]HMP36778.1 hypothetical protein [Phycisphaerales bacterium]
MTSRLLRPDLPTPAPNSPGTPAPLGVVAGLTAPGSPQGEPPRSGPSSLERERGEGREPRCSDAALSAAARGEPSRAVPAERASRSLPRWSEVGRRSASESFGAEGTRRSQPTARSARSFLPGVAVIALAVAGAIDRAADAASGSALGFSAPRAVVGLLPAAEASGHRPDDDIDSLRARIDELERELALARRRVAELERDLAAARARPREGAPGTPGAPAEPATEPVTEPALGAPPEHAPADEQERPGSSPEAFFRAMQAEYSASVGATGGWATPRERTIYFRTLERWIAGTNRRTRNAIDWLVRVEEIESSGERTTPMLVVAVDPADGTPRSGSFEVTVPTVQLRRLETSQGGSLPGRIIRIRGTLVPQLRFSESREKSGPFDSPKLVGPFCEFGFMVENATPLPAPARGAPTSDAAGEGRAPAGGFRSGDGNQT